ncbi:MAG: Ig-like domain-containing protein [Muribaculaceae bacterium]|nr:Ig-like domain-containing protein [Muribaculaceae bacterium]
MKKLLLSLATVALTAAAASAETVTFDFLKETYGLERLSGSTQEYIADGTTIEFEGVTLTLTSALGDASKNGAGSRLWSDGLRCYNGAEVTASVASGTIDAITFTAKTPSSFALNGNTIRYTPTSKNVPLTTVTVEYTPAGSTDLKPAGLEFAETSFTVDLGDPFTAPALVNPNNLPVTWTSSDEAVATVAANGAVTILDAGTTTITAASEATDEYRAGKASYTINVVKVVKANTMAEMLSLAEEGSKIEININFPMTVAYKNGAYTYVTDGTDFTLLYGKTIADYETLDIIPAGWVAKEATYNGLPEFNAVGTMPAATSKGTFTPKTISAADVTLDRINEVVIISEVNFTEATPDSKADVTIDGVKFYNQFGIESEAAGLYNVTAAISAYKGDLQVYPISYEKSTGVGAIVAEGEATYFDLQGRAVKGALQNGLYIRVLNGKATKVLVK